MALKQQNIQRKRKVDPILVDDIPSDDEWITEVEASSLPVDPSWIEEEGIFDGDAIRSVSIPTYESGLQPQESIIRKSILDDLPNPSEPLLMTVSLLHLLFDTTKVILKD